MKKAFAILLALLAVVSCMQIDSPEIPDDPDSGQEIKEVKEIKVSITVNRSDAFDASTCTKATVKDAWAQGDVIYIFFEGVEAPKYMEMKFVGDNVWAFSPKNGLISTDLRTEGKMTAVYLPYGSMAEVVATDGGGSQLTFGEKKYNGVFFLQEGAAYTYNDVLEGALELKAPALPGSNDKYIHFDVSGFTSQHSYALYQDYVKPVIVAGVKANGTVDYSVGEKGDAVAGYFDATNGIVSFSGFLDGSAVGKTLDYEFSINDESGSVLYTRDSQGKTVSGSLYIGIGDISDASTWLTARQICSAEAFRSCSGKYLRKTGKQNSQKARERPTRFSHSLDCDSWNP